MANKKSSVNSIILKTDYPLCEKDEQARCIENMRLAQKKAMKIWNELKKKQK